MLLADSGGLQGYVVYIAFTEMDRPLEPNTFYLTFFMHLHFGLMKTFSEPLKGHGDMKKYILKLRCIKKLCVPLKRL